MSSVKEVIALTFAYYHPGQVLDSTVLEMYAGDLADIPADEVMRGYQNYRRNPKNTRFPLPAVIREIVYPESYLSPEDQAVEIAARIISAVPGCGWSNSKDAQRYIGPIGWSVIQRQGGWTYICENLGKNINPSTFQAQLRKQLEVSIKYGENTVAHAIGASPTRGDGGLLSAGDIVKQLTAKKEAMGGE